MSFGGRLTLVTGKPIMDADTTSSTLYYTQYSGNTVSIGGSDYSFSELTLSLSGLTYSAIYDVFVGLSGGSPYLFLSSAWTDATTRATALARNNGILTNGDNTGSYLGTIQIDPAAATCTAHFSYGPSRRFGVWNMYNQQQIYLEAGLTTSGYYIPSSVIPNWGPLRNDATNSLTVLSGQPQRIRAELTVTKYGQCGPGGAGYPSGVTNNYQYEFAIGWNHTTSADSTIAGLTLEAGDMPTGLALGVTVPVSYRSQPLTGSAVVTGLERRCNYVVAWSMAINECLSAGWMG